MVQLLRLRKRRGLIRARLAGARRATGDVLLFLDAHCEVTKGWLPPILHRIKIKPNAVLIPVIDIIDDKTFEYRLASGKGANAPIGGFTWSGEFVWVRREKFFTRKMTSDLDPIETPTMAGGLFAVNTEYFWTIGSYDNNMDGWGGENLEMSFRIWQCGGSIEIIPCSRVGHIFRRFFPYKFPNDKDTSLINVARTANVWMDDYKRLFFVYHKELKDNPREIGDLTDRINLRKRLQCKSFKWYLQNIYPEKFIPDENVQAYGRVRSQYENLCLDILKNKEDSVFMLGVFTCRDTLEPNQYFSLDVYGQLRKESICAYVIQHSFKVQMIPCDKYSENKTWTLNKAGQLMDIESGRCLDATALWSTEDIVVEVCSIKPGQIWKFDHYPSNNVTSKSRIRK